MPCPHGTAPTDACNRCELIYWQQARARAQQELDYATEKLKHCQAVIAATYDSGRDGGT